MIDRLVNVVERAVDANRIRVDRVRAAVADEWDLDTRRRWDRIENRLDVLVPAFGAEVLSEVASL